MIVGINGWSEYLLKKLQLSHKFFIQPVRFDRNTNQKGGAIGLAPRYLRESSVYSHRLTTIQDATGCADYWTLYFSIKCALYALFNHIAGLL